MVIDINGFGYNKKYSKSKRYEVERLFDVFDDVSEVCEYMKVAFDYIKCHYYYSKSYLYGHSTGGNDVINLFEPLASKQDADRFYRSYTMLTSYTLLSSVAATLVASASVV